MRGMYLPASTSEGAAIAYKAAADVTGDQEWHFQITLNPKIPTATRYLGGGNASAPDHDVWMAQYNTSGNFAIRYSEDGTAGLSSVFLPPAAIVAGEPVWIKYVLDVDGGTGGIGLMSFYYSFDDITWVAAGSVDVAGSSAPSSVNRSKFNGFGIGGYNASNGGAKDFTVHRYRHVDGIDGTIVYDVDFTDLTPAEIEARQFTEDSANAATVTLVGDEWGYGDTVTTIAGKVPELFLDMWDGFAPFTPTWFDRSGNNHHGQWGSVPGANTNEPVRLPFVGEKYIWFPGTLDNNAKIQSGQVATNTSVEFIAHIALDDYTSTIQGIWGGVSTVQYLRVSATGFLEAKLNYAAGAVTYVSTVAMAATDGSDIWVKVVHDTVAGTATFYTSTDTTFDTDAVVWTQLGAVVPGASSGDLNTMSSQYLGVINHVSSSPMFGKMYSARYVRNGIPVHDIDFADAVSPYATFTERANGTTVTINRSTSGYVSWVVDSAKCLYSTDDYIEVPDDAGLDFAAGESFTVMVVWQPNSITNDVGLVNKKLTYDSSVDAGYTLRRHGSNVYYGYISDVAVKSQNAIAGTAVNTKQTAVLRRDVVADEIQVFLDGIASAASTTDATTATLANTNTFLVGAGQANVAPAEGSIEKVVLFREALTDAQILAVSNELAGIPEANTIGHKGVLIYT